MMKMRVLACVCVMAISLTCLSALDEEAGHQKDFNEVTEVPTTEFRLRGVPLAKAIPKAVHPLSPKKPLLTASAHVHKSAHKVNKALHKLAQHAKALHKPLRAAKKLPKRLGRAAPRKHPKLHALLKGALHVKKKHKRGLHKRGLHVKKKIKRALSRRHLIRRVVRTTTRRVMIKPKRKLLIGRPHFHVHKKKVKVLAFKVKKEKIMRKVYKKRVSHLDKKERSVERKMKLTNCKTIKKRYRRRLARLQQRERAAKLHARKARAVLVHSAERAHKATHRMILHRKRKALKQDRKARKGLGKQFKKAQSWRLKFKSAKKLHKVFKRKAIKFKKKIRKIVAMHPTRPVKHGSALERLMKKEKAAKHHAHKCKKVAKKATKHEVKATKKLNVFKEKGHKALHKIAHPTHMPRAMVVHKQRLYHRV